MNGRFVAYYRVSTEQQGRSGLGLEAQQAAVRAYLNGGAWTLLGEFVEVESGKRADRPELARALEHCRLTGAVLVVAKLDRLTRNMAFLAALMDSGVEFVACDNPHANRLTLHLLGAVAEHERGMISARTKAALEAAKARGVALGGDRGRRPTAAEAEHAREASRKAADGHAARVAPMDPRSGGGRLQPAQNSRGNDGSRHSHPARRRVDGSERAERDGSDRRVGRVPGRQTFGARVFAR
jgi:DNA invertase Pin-like site-specific DNA recombinase